MALQQALTITKAGLSLALQNNASKIDLPITHISVGTGKYQPVGTESVLRKEVLKVGIASATKLSNGSLQMRAVLRLPKGAEPVNEIGVWSNKTLIAVYSHPTDTVMTISNLVDTIIDLSLSVASLPTEKVSVVIDQNLDKASHLVSLHEGKENPHPQYQLAKDNRFQKIYVDNNALTLDLTQRQQIIDLFGNSYRESGYLTFAAHNNKESNIQGLPRADKAPIVMTFYLMGGYSIFYCHYPTLNRQYFTGVNFNNPTLTLNWIEVLNSKGTHTTEQLKLTANSWGKLFFPNAKGGEWRMEFNPESETDPRFNLVYTKADKSTRYLSFPVLNKNETAAYRSWVDEQIKANFTRSKVVNEDLNNVKAYGVYVQEANVNATTERHYPVNYAGSLLVLPSAYGVMQQYIPFNTGAIYQRNVNIDLKTWSVWRRVDGIDKIDKTAISHATNGTSTTKVASELAVKTALDQTVTLTGDQKEIRGYKSFNDTLESKYRVVVRRNQPNYWPYMNLIDQSVDMEADKVTPKNMGEILWRAGKANNGDGASKSIVKANIEVDKNITFELGGWDAQQAYKCFLKGWTKDNNVVVGKTTNDGKNRLQVAGTISATTPPVNGSNDQVVTIGFVKALSVGIPMPYPLGSVPPGCLAMNGQRFDKALYPRLAVLYPSGMLPDLRGEFIRGWDNGRGVDKGRNLLSLQESAFQEHHHLSPTVGNRWTNSFDEHIEVATDKATDTGYPASYDYNRSAPTSSTGGSETRPRNIAYHYICLAG